MSSNNLHRLECTEVWGGNEAIRKTVTIPGMRGALFCKPCLSATGGDVYYLTNCTEGIMSRIFLADVVGHGSAVAKVSNWLHEVLKGTINVMDPTNVLRELNHHVVRQGFDSLTTVAGMSFAWHTYELEFGYAGHPPILYKPRRSETWRTLTVDNLSKHQVRNIVLGVKDGVPFDIGRMHVRPGDRIFVYSDGLVEARSQRGEFFGEQRVIDLLNAEGTAEPEAVLDILSRAVTAHVDSEHWHHDDVTMILQEVRDQEERPSYPKELALAV